MPDSNGNPLPGEQANWDTTGNKWTYPLPPPPPPAPPAFDSGTVGSQITSAMGPLQGLLTNLQSQFTNQQQFNQDQAKASIAAQDAAAANPVKAQVSTVNPFAPSVSNTSPMNPFAHHLNEGWGAQAGGGQQQGSPMNTFQPIGNQQQQPAQAAPAMAPGALF